MALARTILPALILLASPAWADPPALFSSWDPTSGKHGFIDRTGKLVIPYRYADVHQFSEGLAAVCKELTPVHVDEDGTERDVNMAVHWEYIDMTGKTVIPDRYSSAPFSEGLAVTSEFGEPPLGYMDRTGRVVIAPEWAEAGDFHDGLAIVSRDRRLRGAIDRTGKLVIPLELAGLSDFSEGMAVVWDGKKYGYIDKKGKVVVRPQYESAEPFSEGLAYVVRKKGEKGHEDGAYIDKKGKVVIRTKMSGGPFREGLARIYGWEEGYWIDKKGKKVIDGAGWVMDFSEGLAGRAENKLYGFIDKTGKYVIPPQFQSVTNFKNGLAQAADIGKDNYLVNYRYIDRTGKVIAPVTTTAAPPR